MASLDIGIDLGTSDVVAMDSTCSIVLREPSVVAVDVRSDKILAIGSQVYKMIGRTPPHIRVVRPLSDGVISDFDMTEALIRYVLRQICSNSLVKPRVSVCVPSGITNVESQAVIDAVKDDARKVYLIEEPVAAAIGAGVDLSRPNGNLIVDIGGGTCDIAVLSLNGIVCKTSLKTAGQRFDEVLMKHMRSTHSLLIGEKTAEQMKMEIGSVNPNAEDVSMYVKGRDLIGGLPRKVLMHRKDTLQVLLDPMLSIVRAVQGILERTPPELVGDIRENGMILTGGGSLLNGVDLVLEKTCKVRTRIADNPKDCVATGTAKSFDYLDQLFDGFITPSFYTR